MRKTVLLLASVALALLLASGVALAAAGALDRTFSKDGKRTTAFGSSSDGARAVLVQGNDKIVAAGFATVGRSDSDFALARYNPDGKLDKSFGGDGRVVTALGASYDSAQDAVLQPDGRIVVAGRTTAEDKSEKVALVRYRGGGKLDRSFGQDGKVILDSGPVADEVALVRQPDGKLVVAGTVYVTGGSSPYTFAVTRLEADGTLDESFGEGGTALGPTGGEARDIALLPDGKLVVAGSTRQREYDFFLARYNPDGTLDESFGDDGTVTTDAGKSVFVYQHCLDVQRDGRLVVAGTFDNGGPTYADLILARYKPDGRLDRSFSDDGKRVAHFRFNEFGGAVEVQRDGKILAGGSLQGSVARGFGDFYLARFEANGAMDRGFGDKGWVQTSLEGSGTIDGVRDLALYKQDRTPKIVAAGFSRQGGNPNYDFALARYRQR